MSGINRLAENLLLRLKVKSAVVTILNCLLCVRLFDTNVLFLRGCEKWLQCTLCGRILAMVYGLVIVQSDSDNVSELFLFVLKLVWEE